MFSKIIYINLDRRPDRNENVINQLKNINYNGNLERFSAIDSKKLDINLMPNNIFTKKAIDDANDTTGKLYNVMTKGAIGCTLSHKLIYEKILYGEDEYVLILEDDITFDDNFTKKYTDIIKKYLNMIYCIWAIIIRMIWKIITRMIYHENYGDYLVIL